MAKKHLEAHCRPSALLNKMLRHTGDVSEGTQSKVIAERWVLGKKVKYYRNGLYLIEGVDLSEQEMHESEILRLSCASILMNAPVGDKKICYVDATKNPVEVWIYNMPLQNFIRKSVHLIRSQQLEAEAFLEQPVRKTLEINHVRNE